MHPNLVYISLTQSANPSMEKTVHRWLSYRQGAGGQTSAEAGPGPHLFRRVAAGAQRAGTAGAKHGQRGQIRRCGRAQLPGAG